MSFQACELKPYNLKVLLQTLPVQIELGFDDSQEEQRSITIHTLLIYGDTNPVYNPHAAIE